MDRDEAILHLCGYLIIQNGLSEYTCQDPYNAFRALSNLDFDLVVTDIEFPAHDGIDLTHYIRTNFPHIQVIVMTPFGDAASAVKAIRAGATDYLRKPFSAEEFQEKLKTWSQGRGPFSKWARSERDGLPVDRTFISNSEIWSSIEKKSCNRTQNELRASARRPSEHQAKVADAVRTLRQIIRRDIEETAIFAAIEEDELRAAYLASADKEESILLSLTDSET